jgi:hypothetical protein
MPNPPLSDHIADQLADPLSALAAMVIVSRRHPGMVQWVAEMLCAEPPSRPHSGGNGAKRKPDDRLTKRDCDDEKLLAAMKSDPDGTISSWSRVIHKSKGSVAAALQRLRDAGLAETVDRRWRLVEPEAPKETPRWTKPLSGAERAHQVHLTA